MEQTPIQIHLNCPPENTYISEVVGRSDTMIVYETPSFITLKSMRDSVGKEFYFNVKDSKTKVSFVLEIF